MYRCSLQNMYMYNGDTCVCVCVCVFNFYIYISLAAGTSAAHILLKNATCSPVLETVSMHVLLAGEMLKSAKQTFNISPVGGFFFCKSASGWGNVKNCLNGCASGWGNVKNGKSNF